MAEHRGVVVFCEIKGDKLLPISTEGLGAGRKLADALGQDLSAVIVGSNIAAIAPQAIMYGASKVYAVDDPLLKEFQSDAYVNVIEKVIKQVMPSVVIMGQTDAGRDIAPRLAFKLDTAATMDCIDLSIDAESKRLLQTKPVYGGNAQAVFITDTDPQIATIRTKAMAAPAPDILKKGEVVNVPAGLQESDVRAKVVNRAICRDNGHQARRRANRRLRWSGHRRR